MTFSIRRALGVAVVAAAAGSVQLAAQGSQAPQVTVGGLVYTQYVYQLKDTVNHLNSFDVKRAYITVIGRFAGGVYTRVTADIYNRGTGDQRKDVMARVSARVLDTDDSSRVGGLRVTAYGQYGKPTTGGARQRWLGMVSYRTKQITLAGEAALTRDSVTAGTMTNGHVYSAFGVYKVPQSKVAVLARVDVFHPQAGNTTDKQTRFIGGASYQLTSNWRLLADWDYVDFQGTPTVPQEATRSQALFQTQFPF